MTSFILTILTGLVVLLTLGHIYTNVLGDSEKEATKKPPAKEATKKAPEKEATKTAEEVVPPQGPDDGGVSKENPIRLIDTLKVENCTHRADEDDYVEWSYTGSFLNGTEFGTGTFSAVLGHGHGLPGVDRGMRGLCVGEKRKMFIHSDLAYRDNLTLIFDVDVKEIRDSGGVSNRKKLKVEWIHRVDNCTKESDAGDYIEWGYIGSFLDGKVFDKGNFTATLGKGSVIKGVDEGMRGLCPGDKRKMVIHSDWGYGDEGTKGIPGGSTLVFHVEVAKVNNDIGMKDEL